MFYCTICPGLPALKLLLLTIVFLLPVIGFISMLDYARKGQTLPQRRQRKRHGLLYWVLLPLLAAVPLGLSILHYLPDLVAPVTVLALASIAFLGSNRQRRIEEEQEKRLM